MLNKFLTNKEETRTNRDVVLDNDTEDNMDRAYEQGGFTENGNKKYAHIQKVEIGGGGVIKK